MPLVAVTTQVIWENKIKIQEFSCISSGPINTELLLLFLFYSEAN